MKIVRPDPGIPWTEKRVHKLLGTMLHEMVHAMYCLFNCRCVDCYCPEEKILTMGLEGHGLGWMELAQNI